MRGLLLLWCVGLGSADVLPPPTPGETPPAQPVPVEDGERERPVPPPERPAVMPAHVMGCVGYQPLALGSLLLIGAAFAQRRVLHAA